jgi:hypothetical protein
MFPGSCACGRVTYEVRAELFGPINHCHCWRCRKQSGASFGTSASIRPTAFVILTGQDRLAHWESSQGVRRFFASCCGSPLYKASEDAPEELRLRLGTLDMDPGVHVDLHYMSDSKVPWITIEDTLPQDSTGSPFGTKD